MKWMFALAALACPATPARAQIDATEAAALQTLTTERLNFQHLVATLGEALVFDRALSVNGTQACATCHTPRAGFAGAGGVMPGAVPGRAGFRVPRSLAYAAFAPVLTYRAQSRDFAGGNLWDMRATGALTGNPTADQAAVPLTSAFEMALPDPACAVRRVARAPYAAAFSGMWGAQSLRIAWPPGTDARCARPADGRAQTVLDLTQADRTRAALSLQQIGLTIAAYEQSPLASPFAAKFDRVQAGQAQFDSQERAGYALFVGHAHCASCHDASGTHALFTNNTSANIGIPRNPRNPFLVENAPREDGYIANPAGPAFTDQGLGGFLASAANANAQWRSQASRFMGAFAVPTLRNVAKDPPGLPRTYGHNGFFHSLGEFVHFLNTRDALPVCGGSIMRTGVDCWPPPEQPANVERKLTGNLGLRTADEAALTAFLGTLTDQDAP